MVGLFPLHFEEIIGIGKKYGLNVSDVMAGDQYGLKSLCEEHSKYFKIYQEYKSYLMKQEITPAHPTRLPELSAARIREIAEQVLDYMENETVLTMAYDEPIIPQIKYAYMFKTYYKIEPSELKETFMNKCQDIIPKIYEDMKGLIKSNCKKQGNNILYFHQLIRARIVYSSGYLKKKETEQKIKELFGVEKSSSFYQSVLDLIWRKMEGREIFRLFRSTNCPILFI